MTSTDPLTSLQPATRSPVVEGQAFPGTPTHSDRPSDGLPPWRTLRDAIGEMNGIEHHYVQFAEKRLPFFAELRAGQNWRDLSEEDQQVALSEAVREAEGGKTGFYRRLAWDDPCPTLVSLPNMPATDLCHPEELRPLSVEEYRQIQCFPNGWELCGDIESQYRQLGNAVPVLLGQAVGLTILEHMRTQNPDDPAPGFRYSQNFRDERQGLARQGTHWRQDRALPELRQAGGVAVLRPLRESVALRTSRSLRRCRETASPTGWQPCGRT